MNVLAIMAVFIGLALVAAIPLVVMLQVADRRQAAVKDVTPQDGRQA